MTPAIWAATAGCSRPPASSCARQCRTSASSPRTARTACAAAAAGGWRRPRGGRSAGGAGGGGRRRRGGGGGGRKAEQVREAGVPVVATSCENCNLQLTDLNAYYKLGVRVVGLMELVVNALVKAKERQGLPLAEAA